MNKGRSRDIGRGCSVLAGGVYARAWDSTCGFRPGPGELQALMDQTKVPRLSAQRVTTQQPEMSPATALPGCVRDVSALPDVVGTRCVRALSIQPPGGMDRPAAPTLAVVSTRPVVQRRGIQPIDRIVSNGSRFARICLPCCR